MVEKQAFREKEAEVKFNNYEETIKFLTAKKERTKAGARLLKGKEIAWETGRQGVLRFYHTEVMSGNSLDTIRLFVHEIRSHSGRHKHQGGFTLFVLKGRGYTTVDGVRHDWSQGDLILLPFKKGGVEHQHFNLDNKPSRWLAFSSIPMGDMVGMMIKQEENYQGYKG